ncbi:MAG: diacylglycerol kinase family protein [Pseudomonadota bacterium]|nr:diacylglycerol kinase family protein [Pseudomonadota bacterium]
MQRLWFISNIRSGSATQAGCEAIEAVCAEKGLALAGRTRFPDDPLPDPAELAAARVDTLMLFAGDGTINAALCHYADWDGAILVLPGGTMNLLAKTLHGDSAPADIVHTAHLRQHRVALPFAEAGRLRAFVGLIVGPAAHWVRAREAAREGRFARLLRAAMQAWRRTFGDHVRITGVPGLVRRYQAILATPGADGLAVAGIDARDWRAIVELGWDWLKGDWMAARAVTATRATGFTLAGRKPVLALFDGEPERLPPGTRICGGMTRPFFLATQEPPP